MTEIVLDGTVVLKWFERGATTQVAEARALRSRFEAGELMVTVPRLLFLEVLNVAGRQWRWSEAALAGLASQLEDYQFQVVEPELAGVAAWVSRGLSAYDATYVALAEARAIPLITDDREVLRIAPELARALGAP